LVGKLKEGRKNCRRENNIERDVKEIGWDSCGSGYK
jgi:hypothetical protein